MTKGGFFVKRFKSFGALALSLVLGLSMLTGCGDTSSQTTTAAGETSTAVATSGGTADVNTLVYNINSATKTIDPALNNAVDGAIMLCNLYEGLTRLDENDMPIPGVAESWDISEDGLKYTFHLRQDAKWSDGQPVKAGDFAYAWQRAIDPALAAEYAYLMYYIKNAEKVNGGELPVDQLGIKVIDDYTLEVELEGPIKYFLSLTAFPVYFPVRKDMVDANPEGWATKPETYITNGMYKVTEMNPKVNTVMVKNENYWNKDIVKLQTVDVRQVEDEVASFSSFQAGEFDMIDKVPGDEREAGVAAGTVIDFPQTGTYFIVLGLDEAKATGVSAEAAKALQDLKVRQALALAIDRQVLTDVARKLGETPAYSFVPPGITNSDGSAFNGKEYFPTNGNVEQAKKLLEEAGYPNGEGFPALVYSYNTGSGHELVAQALQSMWQENLGIEVQLQGSEWATFQQQRTDRNFIIARHGWIADYNDPTTFLEMFTSKSGQNDAGYSNPAYDDLLAQAVKESDPKKRDELLHAAEDIIMSDMPIVPLFHYTQPKGIQKNVKGVRVSPLGFIFFDQVTKEAQ